MGDRIRELEAALARAEGERDELAAVLEGGHPYRQAVEGSSVPIMCVSAAKGRYLFVNDAFASLLNYTREELMARDPYQVWLEVTHPDEVEVERIQIERVAKGEIAGYSLEKRMIPRNGQPRWHRADLISQRDAQDRLANIIVFFHDIHEQRVAAQARDKLQTRLRQADKLGALGKLAGGIAHDFNNRLVCIMGHAELLKSEVPSDVLVHHADMVLASAKGAADLTRQLLAYSRRQVLKPEAFDLNDLVERMHRLLKTVLGDRIELVVALAAGRKVLADPGQIEQVILNLALNARDAMPDGGRLTLGTCDVTQDSGNGNGNGACAGSGELVALVVSDTGTGIPDHVLPHIFEPFFTTKEIGQGTGLGLAMVEGIVHQSKGTTQVESRVGEGTTFTVRLPGAPDLPAAPPEPPASEPPNGSFETVLVCDDDDGVRDLLAGVLGLRAYTILKARNGRHALDVARGHAGRIDLLVTDLSMPELGGIELAAELRRRDPALKVLYISGYSEDADLLSAPLGPGTHFLSKPFLPGELTRTVFSILEGKARRPGPGARA